MHMKLRRAGVRGPSRGFSLVELMVGIAVGMFVVAAAALVTTSQLTDNRRLLLETQLQQDLRAAADIVARDLRRAGFWSAARTGVPAPAGGAIVPNPYSTVLIDATNKTVQYSYRRGAGSESFGFKLGTDGVLRACQSDFAAGGCSSGWQDLTDGSTVEVTGFTISTARSGARAQSANGDALTVPCPALCADPLNPTGCWPTVRVREVVISISGRARSNSAVTRSLEVSTRLRNDGVALSSEAPSGEACPAS